MAECFTALTGLLIAACVHVARVMERFRWHDDEPS
jgi:hypothetical protein